MRWIGYTNIRTYTGCMDKYIINTFQCWSQPSPFPSCLCTNGILVNSLFSHCTPSISNCEPSVRICQETFIHICRSVTTCVDFCHPDFSWKNKQCNLKQNYLCEFGWTKTAWKWLETMRRELTVTGTRWCNAKTQSCSHHTISFMLTLWRNVTTRHVWTFLYGKHF